MIRGLSFIYKNNKPNSVLIIVYSLPSRGILFPAIPLFLSIYKMYICILSWPPLASAKGGHDIIHIYEI